MNNDSQQDTSKQSIYTQKQNALDKKDDGPTAVQVKQAMCKFTPLGDRIVVLSAPVEETTAAGIIIPSTSSAAAKSPTMGTVIAVGPGRYADTPNFVSEQIDTKFYTKARPLPMSVKVDDMVMWNKFAGSNIEIDGIECTIMHESDLIGIIKS